MRAASVVGRVLAFAAVSAVVVLAAAGIPSKSLTAAEMSLTVAVMAPAIVLGLSVLERQPRNVVGTLLVALGTVPLLVLATEAWAATATGGASPWPGARVVGVVSAGSWPWLYVPLVWLAVVFPDGRPTAPRWRVVLVASVLVPLGVQTTAALSEETYVGGGGAVVGVAPFELPEWAASAAAVVSLAGLLGVLIAAMSAIVVRSRRGGGVVRRQIRWFALSAPMIPAALLMCWASFVFFGAVAPLGVAALAVVFVVFPCAVAIAVLRHELYDIDRLISRALLYTTLTALVAGLFVVTAFAAGLLLGRGSAPATGLAAVLCTISINPLRRRLQRTVDRRFYLEREAGLATIRRFVDDVRDGRSPSEMVEATLQRALADQALRIDYRLPADGEGGSPADDGGDVRSRRRAVAVMGSGQVLAFVVPGAASRGREVLVREVVREARLPIELARLQAQLRDALQETAASRARLVRAADDERQRLQRDLHDGAQQRLVALGLDLRHAQRALPPHDPSRCALDRAVEQLGAAVRELRNVAHGLRPSALDDGLTAGLLSLARASPSPVDLDVDDTGALPEAVTTALYFVAAEALANAFKHSGADSVAITLRHDERSVTLCVVDHGIGGASIDGGSGLMGMADRVAAVGGVLRVCSPMSGGTSIEVVVSCGS